MVQKDKKIESECFSMKAEYNSFFFFTTMHALLKASNPYSRLNFIFFPPQLNTNNSQREQESSSSKVRRRREVGQTNEELVRNKIFYVPVQK